MGAGRVPAERAPGTVGAPDLSAGQGGRARRGGHPGRARTWCGAGGFLPSEVMDLAHSTVASAPMWLRPKRRGKKKKKAHNVFLVKRLASGASGFCFGGSIIILRCSLIPDKPALVAGWRGLPRFPTDTGG